MIRLTAQSVAGTARWSVITHDNTISSPVVPKCGLLSEPPVRAS